MFDHLDRLQVDDKPVEIAMRIFENFRRAGQDVKIHQTSVFEDGIRKRVFKVTVFDHRYGEQDFLVGLVSGVLLEGNGLKSIEKMKRTANLN